MIKILLALYPPLGCLLLALVTCIYSYGVSLTFLTWFSLFFVLLFILDTRGRYIDYKTVKAFKCFSILGAFRYRVSWCQRTVYVSIFPEAARVYHLWGYRWYHLTPDDIFTTKSSLLKANFYRQLILGRDNNRSGKC